MSFVLITLNEKRKTTKAKEYRPIEATQERHREASIDIEMARKVSDSDVDNSRL
jgi:hypothetical protein